MLTAVTPDALVPQSHPIQRIKPTVDRVLAQMSSTFDRRIKTVAGVGSCATVASTGTGCGLN